MSQVQVDQKSYEMPPREGFTVAHFLTVADIDRSLRFYETVFGSRILSRGDSRGAPGYIQIANVRPPWFSLRHRLNPLCPPRWRRERIGKVLRFV